jgi:type I restriction enzyme, S subunit
LVDASPGFASGEDLDEGIFQIRMNNVTSEGALDPRKRRRVTLKGKRNGDLLLKPGDVLFNSTNSPELVGKSALFSVIGEPATFSNHFVRLRPVFGKLDGPFLSRWLHLQFQRGVFRGLCKQWVNQATVSRELLLALELPLPPLPEQRRIAAILDQADALRAKRREALAQLDSLTQSIFIEMFGDEVTNSKALAKRPLGELIQVKSGDFLPASAMSPGGDVPVFGGNGVNGLHNVAMFEQPKIVIGRVGAYCGCVHTTSNASWVTDNALYVSRIDESLDFEYLAFALHRAKLNRVASQSGQPLVSASRIYPVEILVPTIDSQQTFATRIQTVESLKTTHRAALAELDALFASLQDRAFSGHL